VCILILLVQENLVFILYYLTNIINYGIWYILIVNIIYIFVSGLHCFPYGHTYNVCDGHAHLDTHTHT